MGVALTAALLAACAAINALMSENHSVKAMTEQIKSSDDWGYYQAKGIKAVLAAKIEMLRSRQDRPPRGPPAKGEIPAGTGRNQSLRRKTRGGLRGPFSDTTRPWPPA